MAYLILLFSGFCLELTLNLPVGAMPLLLSQEGVSRSIVAIVMGSGMFAALFLSIPIGAFVDRMGRLFALRMASALGIAVMALMYFIHGPVFGAVVMTLRSVAAVSFLTAEFAYASTIVSKDRTVSAVGTLGIVGNLAFAAGPACGVYLIQHHIGREQFLYAAIVNVLGTVMLLALPPGPVAAATTHLREHVFMKASWLPIIAFCLSLSLAGGVNVTLAVLTFQDRGIANGALIFTAAALACMLLRYPGGRLVEKYGARMIAIPTALIQALGCWLASIAHSVPAVIIAGSCLGIAWATIVPVAISLFFEKSTTNTRGAAMGAYNMAFACGASIGALIATVAAAVAGGYATAIVLCGLVPTLMLPSLLLLPVKPEPEPEPEIETVNVG